MHIPCIACRCGNPVSNRDHGRTNQAVVQGHEVVVVQAVLLVSHHALVKLLLLHDFADILPNKLAAIVEGQSGRQQRTIAAEV